MPKLYDVTNDQSLGSISQADLDLLMAHFARESSGDRMVNNDTFLALVDDGASSVLLDAIKAALALSAEAQVRWDAD